jgi:hypothetical protein
VRLGLTLLILAGALAALFVSASRSPGTAQTVQTSLFFVNLTGTGCKTTPAFDTVCGSHAQAERIRVRFSRQGLPASVHGETVVVLTSASSP